MFQSLRRRVPVLLIMVSCVATTGAISRSAARGSANVVVVVSASSQLASISQLHLTDLYMGRTTRYPNGSPAVPVDQRAGSAERAVFSETYLGRTEAQIKAHWSKVIFTGRGRPPAEAPNGETMRSLVARDAKAIGYLDRRLVDSSVRVVKVQ